MVECESSVDEVVVYARGALVARRVTLPAALPADVVDLVVSGLTPLAESGSVRALVEGDGREVTALRTQLVIPASQPVTGAMGERVRALRLEGARLRAEQTFAQLARRRLNDAALDPNLRGRARAVDPAARVADALAIDALIEEQCAVLDARLVDLSAALATHARTLEAAEMEAAQARSAELAGEGHPSVRVVVRLGAGGALRALTLWYAVPAARWWPAYTARFTAAATHVQWALEAFVAQVTGEDWTGVKLSLSTADLVHDARLPELPSLRLGRAQAPARKGYRPLPADLDAMFAGFDDAVSTMQTDAPRRAQLQFAIAESAQGAAEVERGEVMLVEETVHEEITFGAGVGGGAAESAPRPMPRGAASMSRAKAAPPPSVGGAPPMLEAASMASAPPARKSTALSFGGGGDGGESKREFAPEEPQAIEPANAWLDFDALTMPDPRTSKQRGRLTRDAGTSTRAGVRNATAALDAVPAPPQTLDPLATRGQFDHRYDAAGRADIPSNARAHRVTLALADAVATPRFRTVPRESAEVYREAEAVNPFDAPLLAGPVDVFIDGALTATSPIAAADKGGTLHVGLGVEDRLRVARNARADETNTGLLGNTTAVEHHVTIDLASSLGRAVVVEVIDRAPVTDDKDVEVTLLASQPRAENYAQIERGVPLRRGLRWRVEVPAGANARVEFGYRVTLPAKSEIVGGNRRE